MNVVMYSRVFPPAIGGMERFAADLAGWMAARGHEVTVATCTGAPAGSDRGRPYRVLRAAGAIALRRALRRADAVHVNGLSLRGIGAAIAAGRRPVVTHAGHQAVCPTGLAWTPLGGCDPGPGPCRVCPGAGGRGRAAVRAHRAGASLATRNVCVSRYLERRLALPRSVVAYNPVSAAARATGTIGDGDDGLVAFAGRLVAEKGLDVLIRALGLLPEARLEVAGDGPLRPALEGLAEGLGPRVRFLGVLPPEGVMELYSRAAVVCVPSLWAEPFGYAAAEAMAIGRPVVATPRGALVELLEDGRGLLARDASPQEVAAALRTALEDGAASREAGHRARAFVETDLSLEAVGPRYEALYRGEAP